MKTHAEISHMRWPLVRKFAGSNPVEAVGPMSQLCFMLKILTITVEVAL
jgi:hypothetical protein